MCIHNQSVSTNIRAMTLIQILILPANVSSRPSCCPCLTPDGEPLLISLGFRLSLVGSHLCRDTSLLDGKSDRLRSTLLYVHKEPDDDTSQKAVDESDTLSKSSANVVSGTKTPTHRKMKASQLLPVFEMIAAHTLGPTRLDARFVIPNNP